MPLVCSAAELGVISERRSAKSHLQLTNINMEIYIDQSLGTGGVEII